MRTTPERLRNRESARTRGLSRASFSSRIRSGIERRAAHHLSLMRPFFRSWLLAPIAALVIVVWIQSVRLERVRHLTALPAWSVDSPTPTPDSATGYAEGRRSLIIPDRLGQSHQWIAQTQTMLERGDWNVRHVDYDNAPFGRETHLPALYRGWLGLLASLHAGLTGEPPGIAVEHAALYADPLLQLFAVLVTTWFVRRHFGSFAAGLVAIGLVTLFPLATTFLPGAPDPQGLSEMCILWSVLPLAACLRLPQTTERDRRTNGYFLLAGAAGGLGLWLNFNTQMSVILGIGLGAIAAARLVPEPAGVSPTTLPWRLWGLSGCAISLLGYAMEYFPDHLTMRLAGNHPLYAVGWLAGGELLHHLGTWLQRGSCPPTRREWIGIAVALLALVAITGVAIAHRSVWFNTDVAASRLTRIDGGLSAASLARWLALEGISARTCATLLPVILLFIAAVPLAMRSQLSVRRRALVFTLGPAVVTACLAVFMLRWWNTLESVALVVLTVATASAPNTKPPGRWKWVLPGAFVAGLGLLQLIPPRAAFRADEFTPAEMQAMLERDLAHWLAQRQPGAVVLAPPDLTTSLWYYGGLRGLTSFDADNREGFIGGLRIAGAPTQQEALTLLQNRHVTHLVLPSWDRSFDDAARESAANPDSVPHPDLPAGVESKAIFIEQLRNWILPLWLKPVAYSVPSIEGFQNHSVLVFEVVEEQRPATLLSQMATYFIDAGMPGHATQLRAFLHRHPTDLGALISLAEIELLRKDDAAFSTALDSVVTALTAGADRYLSWERRVALAAVLARGKRDDLAGEQTRLCFAQVREINLRSLTPHSLFRFLALGRNYHQEIGDRSLRELALQLLPPAGREQLR